MIAVSSNATILLYAQPTDMRKSFDGLAGIVRAHFHKEPTDGSLFLFVNRRMDRIKIMYWDNDGMAIWYKRLEQGTFQRVQRGEDEHVVCIDATELAMLLSGVSIDSIKRRKRFTKAA